MSGHCRRTRAEALPDHIADGCQARAYSEDSVDELAQRGIAIDELDQHDDCHVDWCEDDDDCTCPCGDCVRARDEDDLELGDAIDDAIDELALDELLERNRWEVEYVDECDCDECRDDNYDANDGTEGGG